MPDALWPFLAAAAVSFVLCPLAAKLATRLGIVSAPVHDRWHRAPMPLLGGVAIAVGTLAAVALVAVWDRPVLVMVMAGVLALVLGLVDDKVKLGATAKLVGSLAIGAAVAYLLSTLSHAALPATTVLIAILWFAGIVHAFNLLDNMDGLAGGVAAIVAASTAFVLLESGYPSAVAPLAALGGALCGFLAWNSAPAQNLHGGRRKPLHRRDPRHRLPRSVAGIAGAACRLGRWRFSSCSSSPSAKWRSSRRCAGWPGAILHEVASTIPRTGSSRWGSPNDGPCCCFMW